MGLSTVVAGFEEAETEGLATAAQRAVVALPLEAPHPAIPR